MRRLCVTASLLAPLGALLAAVAVSEANPTVGALRSQIQHATQRERALAAGAGAADRVIGVLTQQLSILGGRLQGVQQQLAEDRLRVSVLSSEQMQQRSRVQRLRVQLSRQRVQLAGWLVAVYEAGRPNALEVLTSAGGFADLLERMDFLHRLSEHGGQITRRVSTLRAAASVGLARLVRMSAAEQQVTRSAAAESAALQSISGALVSRRVALSRARSLQLAALTRTRSQRAALQGRLADALTALVAPPSSPAMAAPSGGFAIPWPIVQCESGGQNLPPNAAGASGYYQILPSTWKGAGGATDQAFQAPRAEQDTVAARLWAGGAGASNWACAALVHAG
jgi:septal ring factor EnvC (AmiA/AmiB activator)